MLFYGQSGAGGVVNAVGLTPNGDNTAAVHIEKGRENLVKTGVDFNGSPVLDASMLMRLMGLHEYKASNALFSEQTRNDLMGVIELNRNDKFTSFINYHWQSYEHSRDENRFSIDSNGNFLPLPDELTFVDNGHSNFKARIGLLSASSHYYPNKAWRLSGNYLWQEERRLGLRTDEELILNHDALLSRSQSKDRLQVNSIANRIVAPVIHTRCGSEVCNLIPKITALDDQSEYETDVSMNLSLTGNFEYLNLENRAVFGLDLYHQDLYQQFTLKEYRASIGDAWVVNEDFQDLQLQELLHSKGLFSYASNYLLKEYRLLRDDFGLYTQIHTRWNNEWMSSIGWRVSKFIGEQRNLNSHVIGLRSNVSDISPQFGVVYQPIDSLSFFTNYSESVAIRYLIDDHNNFAEDPEVAQQWEIGIKRLGFGGMLSWSAAFFDIKNSNTFDVKFEEGIRQLQGPFNHNVSGFESDISYDLSESWQITSHLSILKNKIVGINKTYSPPHVPDITWSMFNHWDFSEAWQATLGAYALTDRSLDINQSSKLNSYVSLNGSLYRSVNLKHCELSTKLIVKNILNNDFFRAASAGGYADRVYGRSTYINFELKM
jgi:iron complex outermembrane receptor protein